MSYQRQDKITTWMNIAKEVAKQSHDSQTQHGAVLIKNNRIVATGYNGFVSGALDDQLPNVRPDKYAHIIHSEINAIINAAKEGISIDGATLICTGYPCLECTKALIQAGITKWILGGVPHIESVEIRKIRTWYLSFFKVEIQNV